LFLVCGHFYNLHSLTENLKAGVNHFLFALRLLRQEVHRTYRVRAFLAAHREIYDGRSDEASTVDVVLPLFLLALEQGFELRVG